MTTALLVVIVFWALLGSCSVAHNLRRLADAIEAQNRHYGIGVNVEVEQKEA